MTHKIERTKKGFEIFSINQIIPTPLLIEIPITKYRMYQYYKVNNSKVSFHASVVEIYTTHTRLRIRERSSKHPGWSLSNNPKTRKNEKKRRKKPRIQITKERRRMKELMIIQKCCKFVKEILLKKHRLQVSPKVMNLCRLSYHGETSQICQSNEPKNHHGDVVVDSKLLPLQYLSSNETCLSIWSCR